MFKVRKLCLYSGSPLNNSPSRRDEVMGGVYVCRPNYSRVFYHLKQGRLNSSLNPLENTRSEFNCWQAEMETLETMTQSAIFASWLGLIGSKPTNRGEDNALPTRTFSNSSTSLSLWETKSLSSLPFLTYSIVLRNQMQSRLSASCLHQHTQA